MDNLLRLHSQAARQCHDRGENPSDVGAVRRRLKPGNRGENFRRQ